VLTKLRSTELGTLYFLQVSALHSSFSSAKRLSVVDFPVNVDFNVSFQSVASEGSSQQFGSSEYSAVQNSDCGILPLGEPKVFTQERPKNAGLLAPTPIVPPVINLASFCEMQYVWDTIARRSCFLVRFWHLVLFYFERQDTSPLISFLCHVNLKKRLSSLTCFQLLIFNLSGCNKVTLQCLWVSRYPVARRKSLLLNFRFRRCFHRKLLLPAQQRYRPLPSVLRRRCTILRHQINRHRCRGRLWNQRWNKRRTDVAMNLPPPAQNTLSGRHTATFHCSIKATATRTPRSALSIQLPATNASRKARRAVTCPCLRACSLKTTKTSDRFESRQPALNCRLHRIQIKTSTVRALAA